LSRVEFLFQYNNSLPDLTWLLLFSSLHRAIPGKPQALM